MTQTALPLYPKISSIYNKIMQLAIAIIFIVVLMNIWIDGVAKDQRVVEQHFNYIGDQYLLQASATMKTMLVDQNREKMEQYLNELSQSELVHSLFVYGIDGQLIAQGGIEKTVKALYGIEHNTLNVGESVVPFVAEIRQQEVLGYIRVNLIKKEVVHQLEQENYQQQQLIRVMLIMAGCAGFFLTRGLSRFSRQGFRVEQNT